MKKYQLKEAIKAEIKSLLSEDFNDDNRGLAYIKSDGERDGFESFTQYAGKQELKNIPDLEAYTDGFAKGVVQKGNKLAGLISRATRGGGDEESLMGLVGLKEGTWSSGTYNEIGRFIQDLKNLKDKYYNIVGNDDVFDGLDRAEESAREMMINAPENRSDITEDEEPTSAEVKKEKSIAAEKEAALKAQKALKDLKDKMKKKAKEFKEAEGDAKEKIKAELKKMTAEKKKLEKDT